MVDRSICLFFRHGRPFDPTSTSRATLYSILYSIPKHLRNHNNDIPVLSDIRYTLIILIKERHC